MYSGEWLDPSLNLYNLRARYYNALTGRFETMDPVAGDVFDPRTLHKYVFTGDKPVNYVDPTGQDDVDEYNVRSRGTEAQAYRPITSFRSVLHEHLARHIARLL